MSTLKYLYRSVHYNYIAWWALCTLLQTFLLYYTVELDRTIALLDAVLTNLVLALGGYIIINVMRFYQASKSLSIIYSLGLAILCVSIIQKVAQTFLTNDPAYAYFLNKSFLIRGVFAWLMMNLITAVSWIWFYTQDQQESEKRKLTTEKLAREAELSTLRQQLQPHFLFNSLNSINALVGSKPEDARKMIQQLSDFLRGTLRKDDQQLITLSEELRHLQLYLDIEKVRFGHRLKTNLEYDDNALSMTLPSLLLQPIVENAIKFGLYDTRGGILIAIKAYIEGNYLVIYISNPFDPATAQPRQGTGFGLNSIQRRLYLLYARNDLLTTSQDKELFKTIIKIPQSA